MEQTNENLKKEERLMKLFQMMKAQNALAIMEKTMTFNHTELRMISEILAAKHEEKRLISTQLADILGITRSAVSQIVRNLEEEGVVVRMPDAVDRKIAYIEISDEVLERFGEDITKYTGYLNEVVSDFGEDNFEKMYQLFIEFTNLMQEKGKKKKKEKSEKAE